MSIATTGVPCAPTVDALRDEFEQTASVRFTVVALLLTVFAFIAPFVESWTRSTLLNYDNVAGMDAALQGGTLWRQIALGSLGLFGFAALAWPEGKRFRVRWLLGAVCLAYLAWCVASCFWTDDFGMSSRRIIALACEVVAGLAIAKRASPRQFVWFVFGCTVIWLGLGITAELSLGTFLPWRPGYRFAGVFHPNEMGMNCGLLVLASLYLAAGIDRGRSWLYAVAGVGFLFLLSTGSRAALGAALVAMAAQWFFTASMSRRVGYALVIGFVALSMGLVASAERLELSSDVIALGRKDSDAASLTGRTFLWEELLEYYASEAPLVGHGYGAFWTFNHIAEISKSQAWPVASSHSAYIDLVLNVGVFGGIMCLTAMALAISAAMRRERQARYAGYGYIAMIVVYGLAAGYFETTIGTTWFMSFFGICGVSFLFFQDQPAEVRISPGESIRSNDRLHRFKGRLATA